LDTLSLTRERARERVPDIHQRAAPNVIRSETSASETTRDQRAAITHPARMVELRRIDLLDPLSNAAWPVYDAADNWSARCANP